MNVGQEVTGVLDMKVNDDKSYDVNLMGARLVFGSLVVELKGTSIKSSGFYQLQDQTYYVA